jgi:hypothetical protein
MTAAAYGREEVLGCSTAADCQRNDEGWRTVHNGEWTEIALIDRARAGRVLISRVAYSIKSFQVKRHRPRSPTTWTATSFGCNPTRARSFQGGTHSSFQDTLGPARFSILSAFHLACSNMVLVSSFLFLGWFLNQPVSLGVRIV